MNEDTRNELTQAMLVLDQAEKLLQQFMNMKLAQAALTPIPWYVEAINAANDCVSNTLSEIEDLRETPDEEA